jgi:hypothetical protein
MTRNIHHHPVLFRRGRHLHRHPLHSHSTSGRKFPEPDIDLDRQLPAKKPPTDWFAIATDLTAINQDGKTQVKLSDLKGKVWIAAEFFAVCPHCAVRNGEELKKIHD